MPLENFYKENLLHFRRSGIRNMPNCILNYLFLISWSWRPLSFFKQLNMRAYIVSIAFLIVINTLLELLVQQSIKCFQRIKRLHFLKNIQCKPVLRSPFQFLHYKNESFNFAEFIINSIWKERKLPALPITWQITTTNIIYPHLRHRKKRKTRLEMVYIRKLFFLIKPSLLNGF